MLNALDYRFWFFEARKNPETAPLTVWLQGEVRLYGYGSFCAKLMPGRMHTGGRLLEHDRNVDDERPVPPQR